MSKLTNISLLYSACLLVHLSPYFPSLAINKLCLRNISQNNKTSVKETIFIIRNIIQVVSRKTSLKSYFFFSILMVAFISSICPFCPWVFSLRLYFPRTKSLHRSSVTTRNVALHERNKANHGFLFPCLICFQRFYTITRGTYFRGGSQGLISSFTVHNRQKTKFPS